MIRTHQRQWPRLILLALIDVALILLLQGCLGTKPEQPLPSMPAETTIDVYLAAAQEANTAPSQTARPILIRLYSLKSAGRFSAADFYSLDERDAEILGDSLLSKEEVMLQPDSGQRLSLPVPPATTYLGVVAAFREIDQAQWRDLVPITPNHANQISVVIESNAVHAASR